MKPNSLRAPSTSSAAKIRAPSLKSAPSLHAVSSTPNPGQQLLNALWRSPGKIHQICSLDRATGKFSNTCVPDVSAAVRLAQDLSKAGRDAYLACAEYITPNGRAAANASGAYALWMDIDCGDAKATAGKGYSTEADALTATKKFCNDAGLPMPTHIVSSGNGLHLYWVLDDFVDRVTWQKYAAKLKALTKALGFLADDSRTSDIASVLRAPGTFNYKYEPPKPVILQQENDTFISQVLMLAAIESAVSRLCVQSAKTLRAPSPKIRLVTSNNSADTSDYGPPDLETLASALTLLDPDCDESTWKLQRLAPLARAAGEYPEIAEKLRTVAISWSSGELRGQASQKWSAVGCNGKTGEQAFEGVWQRFLNEHIKGHTGSQTTLGTIYHDAKVAGWIDTFKGGEAFERCETNVIEPTRTPIAEKIPAVKSIDLLGNAVLSRTELTVTPQTAPAAIVTKEPVRSPLEAIQQQFALIKMDGKVWVLDGRGLAACNDKGTAQKLVLSNRMDGGLLIQRAVKAQFPELNAKTISNEFSVSPQTICYDGVEFNPRNTTRNLLNLWVGPTIDPKAGAWTLIRSFLLDVICDGDQASHIYLIRFIAHALQHPEKKPGVMIILIGGQGTGKGTLGRILRKIWTATYLQISNIDNVVGNFNASLERAYIVFMDEALFSGNRRGSDALKSLVTEETIYINEKHQPARQVESYHRFFAATNADHFKNTERDDRRDFTLRVSEARKGDHAYWTALTHEMENGGVEAMAHDLLAMDLTGFNVRNKPETKELLAQKLHSLNPTARWWYDCLNDDLADWPDFISTQDVIADICETAGGKLYRKPTAVDVAGEMAKLCPSATKKQKQDSLARHRGFSLPGLPQARAEFEGYMGGSVPWELDIEVEPALSEQQVQAPV